MNLYYVQDDDRPMHVVALDFGDAVSRWRRQIGKENEGDEEYTPKGVTLIASGTDADSFPDLLLPEAAPATPPPAPAQAGWTEEQKNAAEDVVGACFSSVDPDAVLHAIARVAPLFAPKVRVRLPDDARKHMSWLDTLWVQGYCQGREEFAAALRAAGVEIEGEQ